MQAIKLLLAIGFVGGVAVVGCGSDDPPAGSGVCTPGKQEACACPGGTQGVQSCNAGGTGYDACLCGNSSGNGSGSGSGNGSGSGSGNTTAGGGSNPTGGAGGSGSGPCTANDCETCAQSTCAANECTQQIDECGMDPECQKFGDCINACMDEACFNTCLSTHGETAANLWANADGCKYCGACGSVCTEICE